MNLPDLQATRVRGDGIALHVETAGEGPPVLLLHGFPQSPRAWKHQVGPLVDAGFSVTLPELRGYGRSDRPAGIDAYHLRHLVADVAALVRASGHVRAHIVGHDWGGVVAWTFAAAHPEMVDRLVILNAPHVRLWAKRQRRPTQFVRSLYAYAFQLPVLPERALAAGDFALLRQMNRALHARPGSLSPGDLDAYVDALRPPGALGAALNYYRALRRPGAYDLGSRTTPSDTLVVWGDRDPTLGLGIIEGLHRVAPNARIHRIASAGHTVQMDAPEEVNAVLIPFLRAETD